MKTLNFFLAVFAVLILFMSCAGGPADSVLQDEPISESEAVENETDTVKVITIWKPELIVYKYVDGTIDKTIRFSYDRMGNELQKDEYDGKGELLNTYKIQYDQGNLLNMEVSDAGGIVSKTLFEADNQGNILSEVKQDAKGNILSIIKKIYIGNELVSSTAFDANEIPSLKSVYSYQDNELQSIEYQLPDGSLDARMERSFENGVAVKEQVLLADGTVETARTYSYADNLLVGEVQFAGTIKIKSAAYEYDDNKNMIRETWSDRKGNDFEIIEHSWISFEINE